MSLPDSVLAFYWSRTPTGAVDECWNWRGWTVKGYGYFDKRIDGVKVRVAAHQVACELRNGPAPAGKRCTCHTCHNPTCVNPNHLYWGDQKDNARDRDEAGRQVPGGRTGCTECINGHDYTPENTYWEPRGRACKECRREAVRRFRARKRAERAGVAA